MKDVYDESYALYRKLYASLEPVFDERSRTLE